MFQWLRRRRRQLFKYHDGNQTRYGDPLLLWRKLENDPEYVAAVHVKLVLAGDEEATAITVSAARRVFGVEAWDERTGKGLTESETIWLLDSFYEYIENVKKNTNASPTSPDDSESTSPDSSGSTTSDTVPSGSASPDRNSGQPTASEQAQV